MVHKVILLLSEYIMLHIAAPLTKASSRRRDKLVMSS
jgi:hypothetical protein